MTGQLLQIFGVWFSCSLSNVDQLANEGTLGSFSMSTLLRLPILQTIKKEDWAYLRKAFAKPLPRIAPFECSQSYFGDLQSALTKLHWMLACSCRLTLNSFWTRETKTPRCFQAP